jgi:hypothetical protein
MSTKLMVAWFEGVDSTVSKINCVRTKMNNFRPSRDYDGELLQNYRFILGWITILFKKIPFLSTGYKKGIKYDLIDFI